MQPAARGAAGPAGADRETGGRSQQCPNCERPTAGSNFCGECGQSRRDPSRALPLLLAEAAAEFFSVDGNTVRTIRSLARRPGALTAEWVAGRRARQTAPLKLYLGASAAFFLGFLMTRPIDQAYYGLEGGGSAAYANAMARALILLLPALAVLFRILAPVRRRPFVQQLVFTLHFGAAALLWTLAMTLTAAALKAMWGHYTHSPAWLPDFVLWLYLPGSLVMLVYLAASMRGAWGDGWPVILARTAVSAVAILAMAVFLLPRLLDRLV